MGCLACPRGGATQGGSVPELAAAEVEGVTCVARPSARTTAAGGAPVPGPPRSRSGGPQGCCASCRGPVSARVVCRAGLCVSWAAWGPLLAGRQGWVTWSASTYLHLLGALGPLVAAVVVTALVAVGTGWRVVGQATACAVEAAGCPCHPWAADAVPGRRGRGPAGRGQWPALDRFGPAPSTRRCRSWPTGWPTSCSTGSARGRLASYLQPTLEQRRPVLERPRSSV